jgi:hypothetical protein
MSSVAENLITIDQALGQPSLSIGLMLIQGREKPVDYALYEICHHNIGIITAVELKVGTQILIDRTHGHIIPTVVHAEVPRDNLPEGYNRYRLISVDPDIDFETFIPELSQRSFAVSQNQLYHVRFARFKTEIPTRVDARTFGSPEIYGLKTINVSKSGFLLASPPGFRVPFNESTLLELTVHLDDEDPISFLGKVIRCEFDFEKKMKRFGINICEITPQARERYDSYIEDVEHRKNRQIFRLLNMPMPV